MDARLTPAEREFFYAQHCERESQQLDRLSLALRQAAHVFAGGDPAPLQSRLNRFLTTTTAQQQREFPFDVPYLSAADVRKLLDLRPYQDAPPWTAERAAAHLGDDPVPKRASVHPRLWDLHEMYRKAGRPMTTIQLKRWIEIVAMEETLTPPTWFLAQWDAQPPSRESLPCVAWLQELQRQGVDVEETRKRLFGLTKEAGADLT